MDPLAKFVVWRYAPLRIETIQTAKFFRRVGARCGGDVLYPTAGMGQPLRFRQVGLAPPQLLLRLLALLDVEDRRIPLHDVSHFVAQRHSADQEPPISFVRP